MRIGQAPEFSLTYYPVFLFFRKERVYCSFNSSNRGCTNCIFSSTQLRQFVSKSPSFKIS